MQGCGTLWHAAKSGTTQGEVINVAEEGDGVGDRDGGPRPALRLTDAFRKGIFKQSDAECLDSRVEVERATDASRVPSFTASYTPST